MAPVQEHMTGSHTLPAKQEKHNLRIPNHSYEHKNKDNYPAALLKFIAVFTIKI